MPTSLTLLMKLRLMNTPVRIHPPNSRISVPTAPICVRSSPETSMPNAPPHPVEQQRLQRSAKAKPRVNDPRIMMKKSERIEWFTSSGRWRMILTPINTSITGIRMPNSPNERSTSIIPSRAPATPQRFSTSAPVSSRSSTDFCSTLWSGAQLKNEKNTAAAVNTPTNSNNRPAIQRALSRLERCTFCRPLGDVVFLDAIFVTLDLSSEGTENPEIFGENSGN